MGFYFYDCLTLFCVKYPKTTKEGAHMTDQAAKYIRFIISNLEGGYVNHPSDPGGETNYGITKATAKKHGYAGSMRDLPLSTAESIYRKSYWDNTLAAKAPQRLALHLLDMSINSGPTQSTKTLQRALDLNPDGIAGPKTMEALHTRNEDEIILLFNLERMRFYASLPTFNTFGKGWTNRLKTLARNERALWS